MDIINKMYSQLTTAPAILETKKEPFTKEQIKALWNIKDKPYVDTVLILMYTGMRINELLTLKADNIDLINKTITGGSKTSAGKGRIIPIHPRIFDFVKLLTENGKSYLVPDKNNKKMTPQIYYHHWKNVMTQIGAENKTPHECRHTFRSLLDSAKANKRCIDMLMGHKTGDVGERIYTHKTLNELRETIDLLQ